MCSFAGAYAHLYCVERERNRQNHAVAERPQVEKRED